MYDPEEFEKLPILSLIPGNEPTSLNAVQRFLLPYLDTIEIAYWVVFWGLLIYLAGKYLIYPMVSGEK